jgi:hypothetical protein
VGLASAGAGELGPVFGTTTAGWVAVGGEIDAGVWVLQAAIITTASRLTKLRAKRLLKSAKDEFISIRVS